jgi:hypothetical protein
MLTIYTMKQKGIDRMETDEAEKLDEYMVHYYKVCVCVCVCVRACVCAYIYICVVLGACCYRVVLLNLALDHHQA